MPATIQRKPAHVAASVQDLLALWHGDQDSLGYWHRSLVVAVCERTQPENLAAVRSRFYPGLSRDETPREAREMISGGFQDWKARA